MMASDQAHLCTMAAQRHFVVADGAALAADAFAADVAPAVASVAAGLSASMTGLVGPKLQQPSVVQQPACHW